jgi:hypothetical protein
VGLRDRLGDTFLAGILFHSGTGTVRCLGLATATSRCGSEEGWRLGGATSLTRPRHPGVRRCAERAGMRLRFSAW